MTGSYELEFFHCPLCGSRNVKIASQQKTREIWECSVCALFFVPPRFHCTKKDEYDRYLLHQNDISNRGYVQWLQGVADEFIAADPTVRTVLDYGCGRGRVMEKILGERGISCVSYDPLFQIGISRTLPMSDAVILCEVIEHFRIFSEELLRIKSLCTDKTCIYVRTSLWEGGSDIGKWWYASDCTHINFFTPSALEYAASVLHRKLRMLEPGRSCLFIPER